MAKPHAEQRDTRTGTATIAGRKPVMEALRAGTPLERIYVVHGLRGGGLEELRALAERGGVRVTELSKERFEALPAPAHAQGVLALLRHRRPSDPEKILADARGRGNQGFLLLLDEIEDPQNLGALIRTAECAGVQGVLIPRHHSARITDAVVKASAGATEHLPVAEVTNLVAAMEELKRDGFWVVGLDAAGEKVYTEYDYAGPVAVVVGNEGRGLRRLVRERCDVIVKIPLLGRIGSLNASVAGALVMYEAVRQRRKG